MGVSLRAWLHLFLIKVLLISFFLKWYFINVLIAYGKSCDARTHAYDPHGFVHCRGSRPIRAYEQELSASLMFSLEHLRFTWCIQVYISLQNE